MTLFYWSIHFISFDSFTFICIVFAALPATKDERRGGRRLFRFCFRPSTLSLFTFEKVLCFEGILQHEKEGGEEEEEREMRGQGQIVRPLIRSIK